MGKEIIEDNESEKISKCIGIYNYIRDHVDAKPLPYVMAAFNLLFAELLYMDTIGDVNEEYDEESMIDKFFSDFKRSTIEAYNDIYKDDEGNLKK